MKRPPVAVVGFGRCGSTMTMRMLRAGGIPFADGAHPECGEHEGVRAAIAALQPGTAAKFLDPTDRECRLPAGASEWVFLWLDRDPIQQARSWAKMLFRANGRRATPFQLHAIRQEWAAKREVSLRDKLPGRVHVFRFEDFIEDPHTGAQALADALPEYNLDVAAMAAVVHNRKPECRPDLIPEDVAALFE